ncbi:MAG: PAS domain S-box protein [Chthoniobacteraceae bacterium]|nr:PAS domain S-box protein [Chthoniobacteraceae bacterium]
MPVEDLSENSKTVWGIRGIVLIYMMVAGGWISITDHLVAANFVVAEELEKWSVYKGLLFVLATGGLLYVLISRLTERLRRTTQSLGKSEKKYRLLIENSPDAIFVHQNGQVVFANPAAVRLFRAKEEADLLGRSPLSFPTPEFKDQIQQRIAALLHGESVPLILSRIERLDGEIREVEGAAIRFDDENGPSIKVILRDVTDRIRKNAEIRRLNRIYAVLSQVNQAVVRLDTREELFRQVCDVVIKCGKFSMAWIGEYDRQAHIVRPMVSSGVMPDLGTSMVVHPSEACREGHGLVEPTILKECTCVSNDYAADPRTAAWHDVAREFNYGSVISLPIRRGGTVYGVLVVAAKEKHYFQRKEVKLLEEVAMDVSFAIDRMDQEALRREAEESLKKSEEKFRTLFAASHDAILLMDQEHYLDCNEAALKLLRYPNKEALRSLPVGGISPKKQPTGEDSTKVVRDRALKTFETGMERFEWILQRYDGTDFPAEISLHCMELEGRSIVQEVVRDISWRKETEQQLRQLSQVVEQSPNAVVITNTKGEIEYVNPKFTEVTGYSRAEVLGRNPRILKSGDKPPEAYKNLWETITAGCEWRGEFHNRKKNGELFWESASICPLTNKAGAVTHFLAIKEDINERKRTEEALRKSEEKFFKAFNTAPAVMAIFTLHEGRCIEINDAFVEISGYGREEAIGRTVLELGLIEHPADLKRLIKKLIDDGSLRNEECQYRTKAGESLVGLISAELIDVEGVSCVISITLDITERKQMEEKFLRVQRMESIGALAGGMAHDLNNILAPIMMSASMLGNKKLNAETRAQLIAGIEEAAQRGANIVNQVLTFARGVKGEHTVLDTRLLAAQIGQMVKEIFPKSIAFNLSLPDTLWNITGDSTQLQQVFLNLCVNARDAMPQGGTLALSVENCEVDSTFAFMLPEAKPGCYVEFKVADSGTGIPKRIIDRIFEPFFTTKEPGKGTGLGLSTVVGIVRSHGGLLKVDSELGKGSVFHIFLPATTDAAPTSGQADLPSVTRGHGETVLVVDDEPEILQIIETVLGDNGWKVVTAADGLEGVAAFLNHSTQIKAVLTDMVMPNMDGLNLIRSLRKLAPDLPILVSSGYSNEESREELRELRVNAFLKKPFSARQLLAHVVAALYEKPGDGK